MAADDITKKIRVKDNLTDDRQAGLDQRGGNESRDVGSDAFAASHESPTAAESLRGDVEKDDEQQQLHPKTGEELGIEVRHPSDGAEAEVDPDE